MRLPDVLLGGVGAGRVWALATVIARFATLFTGRYPPGGCTTRCGRLRWDTRVEDYLLLLHDEYPPFSLE